MSHLVAFTPLQEKETHQTEILNLGSHHVDGTFETPHDKLDLSLEGICLKGNESFKSVLTKEK